MVVNTSSDNEFARVNRQQSGILLASHAADMLGRGIVRGHVRSRRWRKICRDVVMTSNGLMGRPQQLWTAVLVAGPDALLAGVTALTEAGVRGLKEGTLRILVPAERKVSQRLPKLPDDMPPIRVTRTRVLPAEHRLAGIPPRSVTARALIDAAVWAPSGAAARTIIAMTFQQRRVTADEVFEVLATRRRLPRAGLIKQTVFDVAGGAQALSEIDFKMLCQKFDLPPPDLQEKRVDGAGRTRYLDAYWKRWRIHAEVDGSHHMDAKHWADDMLRQNNLWISGDRVLRFPAALIRSQPEVVVGQLRAALEAGGWRS